MPRRPPLLAWLHLLLLGGLLIGVCLQPALAAACEAADARIALGQESGTALTVADEGHAGDAGGCCASPACGACCLHATASLPPQPLMLPASPTHACVAPRRAGPAIARYPVDSRPPIRN